MFQLHKRFSLVTAFKFWQNTSTTPFIVKHGTLNKSGCGLSYLNVNIWVINHNRSVFSLYGNWHKSNCVLKYAIENNHLKKTAIHKNSEKLWYTNFGTSTIHFSEKICVFQCTHAQLKLKHPWTFISLFKTTTMWKTKDQSNRHDIVI